MNEMKALVGQLAGYGQLIASVLVVLFGGMVAVVVLYRLVSRFVKPGGKYGRAIKVFFGAIYAMVLVIAVLIAAQRIGLPVQGLAGPAILIVMVISVVVFFLVPFLPRLPFVLGDMVQIRDVTGIVDAITAYQVVVRSFDGQTIFIPTALVMASPIRNFSAVPHRRIQMDVDVYAEDDIERARSLLLETMDLNANVLAEPAPAVFVTGVTGERASMVAFCWVANEDWFGTRDALWVALSSAFADDDKVRLALPRLDIATS
ncbi:mechanosensitive ion channel family protein [Pseudohalioglobus lutimaris]|uniref:Small-conductance mechanosensitive channel n=1 Tax=Pseudohalioglobus lutimaris TaxID=1737061 RepID=A0A2N5X1X5_9GAMM|nr:mechanosensitive ion channel domain-containing protein [Pseudohalioglobus lutimaris]PLW68478.1 hypothetical protein C0039_11925 [Pseudohalioglobus lutimaris]